MVGDSLGRDPDEFLGIPRTSSVYGRRRGLGKSCRPAVSLASTPAPNDDFFYGRVLDGFMRPGDGIVHLHPGGADLGLGGARGIPGSRAALEPAHPLD